MTELKMEHVLMFTIIALMLYYLLGKCGCRGNGFRVGAQGKKPNDLSCKGCGLGLATTMGTVLGPDEVPILGEFLMTDEGIWLMATCSKCGLDTTEVIDCLNKRLGDGQDVNSRICTCSQKHPGISEPNNEPKICTPGSKGYDGYYDPILHINPFAPPPGPPPPPDTPLPGPYVAPKMGCTGEDINELSAACDDYNNGEKLSDSGEECCNLLFEGKQGCDYMTDSYNLFPDNEPQKIRDLILPLVRKCYYQTP